MRDTFPHMPFYKLTLLKTQSSESQSMAVLKDKEERTTARNTCKS